MRDMKDSGIEWIGEIPVDWSMKRVKHIFTRKNEKAMQENPTILSLARDGVKVRDISNNEGQIAESYYNYNPVEEGDLLLNPMDLYSGANCSISKVQGVISPAYINLKANAGVNPDFYDYYFKVQYWLMAFFSYGKGVSYDNRWTLSAETLMNYPVVSLSYDEQCKRADYLDRKCSQIDAIIARQQEVIEKLKAYKLSVITEAVTSTDSQMCRFRNCITTIEQGWSPAPAEIVGEDGWFVLSLSAVKNGKFIKLSKKPIDANENIPTQLSIKVGDLLMTRSNTRELVGDVCLVDSDCPKTIFSDLIYRISLNDTLLPCYAIFLLQSAFIRQQIQESARGSSGTMPKISHKSIKNLNIYLPSIPEQREISGFLRNKCNYIDTCIQEKERLIKKLTAYKKSLIYEVVTGKKEV